MAGAQASNVGQVLQGERVLQVCVHISGHPFQAVWRQAAFAVWAAPIHIAIVFDEVVEQQGAGAAQLQMVGRILPIGLQQKQLIKLGNVGILAKRVLVQHNVLWVLVPRLRGDVVQMRIGKIQVHKTQFSAYVPFAVLRLRHQTKPAWPAAVFPTVGRFLVAFIAFAHIHAQGVVVAQYRYMVALVAPLSQLHARAYGDAVVQHRMGLLQLLSGLVSHGVEY